MPIWGLLHSSLSLMNMWRSWKCSTTKESTALLSQLKKIVMLGRQAGYFLIVACQRPDAKYFGDGIRDNFNFRVGLGRMSELGYGMLFGSDVKNSFPEANQRAWIL